MSKRRTAQATDADADIVWAPYKPAEDAPSPILGLAVGIMIVTFEKWVHRRVESVQFVGQARLRRRVSVDFRLPRSTFPSTTRPQLHLVPLTFLKKAPLTSFDLCDESGKVLPLLTRRENAWVSWSLLVSMAEFVLRRRPSQDLIAILRRIASADEEEALQAIDELESSGSVGKRLVGEPLFWEFVNNFARYFLLLVAVTPERGARKIVKFSYDEPFPWGPWQAERRIGDQLSWTNTEFVFELPAVGYCGSFHLEVECPSGLEIADAEIRAQSSEGQDYVHTAIGPTPVAHLYLTDVPSGSLALARVRMRPEVRGFVRSALLITLGTASLSALGSLFPVQLQAIQIAGSGGSLLLAVPGIIAGFIARPGEHQFVSRVLVWLRGAVVVTGLCSYSAAILLATNLSEGVFSWAWATLGAFAWGTSVVVTGAFLQVLSRYPQLRLRNRRS